MHRGRVMYEGAGRGGAGLYDGDPTTRARQGLGSEMSMELGTAPIQGEVGPADPAAVSELTPRARHSPRGGDRRFSRALSLCPGQGQGLAFADFPAGLGHSGHLEMWLYRA